MKTEKLNCESACYMPTTSSNGCLCCSIIYYALPRGLDSKLTVQALMAAASSQGMMESLQQASRTSVIGEFSSSWAPVESWPACCSSRCFSWRDACSASNISGRSLAFICRAGQSQLQLLTRAMTRVHTIDLCNFYHGHTLHCSCDALPCLLLQLPHK